MQVNNKNDSLYCDGFILWWLIIKIIAVLITVCTIGLGYPFALCMVYGWEIKHTVVDGVRLQFTGSSIDLFCRWIGWIFLSIITFGLYGFFAYNELLGWKEFHTVGPIY